MKKDENHYKKLYKKLKKVKLEPDIQLRKAIVRYKTVILTLCKKEKNEQIVLARTDFIKLDDYDELDESFDKDMNLVLKIKNTRPKEVKNVRNKKAE